MKFVLGNFNLHNQLVGITADTLGRKLFFDFVAEGAKSVGNNRSSCLLRPIKVNINLQIPS